MPGNLPQGTALVGVRPDDLLLNAPDDAYMTITGTVALLEPAGAESHIYVTALGLAETITVRVAGLPSVQEGASISLFASLSSLHPFNAGTGQRVG